MVSRRFLLVGALCCAPWVIACGGEGSSKQSQAEPATGVDGPSGGEPGSTPPGISVRDGQASFVTEEFTLEPGEERFLCFAATAEEALDISGYAHEGSPVVHHVIFSKATSPEPAGFSECETLFRLSWEPLYLAGAGSSSIEFPEGMGHRLESGTQLVAQLHLLNSGGEPVTESLEILMNRSTVEKPRPVGTFVVGSLDVQLAPRQPGMVQGTCELDEEVQVIAAFPHMHLLGKSLTLEVGPTEDALSPVFARDPYDFDQQNLVPMDLTLRPGDFARVTCNYDNTLDETVTFGESTLNEMCFFIAMAPDRSGVSACVGGGSVGDPVPVDPEAGVCGEHEPAADGVGLPCTRAGNECPGDLSCTADYRETTEGVCFRVGCESHADCGGGFNTCCAPPSGGGAFNICIPEACRLPECVPL